MLSLDYLFWTNPQHPLEWLKLCLGFDLITKNLLRDLFQFSRLKLLEATSEPKFLLICLLSFSDWKCDQHFSEASFWPYSHE